MAQIYLNANETFALTNNATVYGASGFEHILISGTPNINLDASLEEVDFEGNISDYDFMVEGTKITVTNGAYTVTFASLNQDCTLRFADGSATLSLTAMNSATLGGSSIGTTPSDVTPTVFNNSDVSVIGIPTNISNLHNMLTEWMLV
ncbi:MAG: hypothetical protein HQK77_00990 [Desulfobacterales bacterium]|nr:hypothetical protein [Desulfobacterales bacterium]